LLLFVIAPLPSVSTLFPTRRSSDLVRAGVIARADDRAIHGAPALGADSRVGARRVTRDLRAALSPCRAAMACVERLRRADAGADPEFYSHTHSELPGNH